MARKLICGSRHLTDTPWAYMCLADAIQPWDEVIVGGAKGADTIAEGFARGLGCKVTVFKADWRKYGKMAGPIRNQRMIDEGKPDMVFAFPGGPGTQNMISLARKAGIEVIMLAAPDKPKLRDTRSPIERMVDAACGIPDGIPGDGERRR